MAFHMLQQRLFQFLQLRQFHDFKLRVPPKLVPHLDRSQLVAGQGDAIRELE